MESFFSDLNHSLRMFRRSPGFTITAVTVLALGIGANTAIFSVVNAVLLKPIAAPEAERVVVFLSTDKGGASAFASDIKFNLWKRQTSIFQDVSGYYHAAFNLTAGEESQRAYAMCVTADYFRLFGLPIPMGRSFAPDEERPNGARVVILGNGFWRRAFGGDPAMVGKRISLDDASYEVIGIMADGIRVENAEEPPDLWLPFPIDPDSSNQVHYFQAAGRLKPGVTLEMANAQLRLTTTEFRRIYPNSLSASRGDVFSVQPLRDFLVKDVRSSLLALAGAVSLVLLIACANVANLLLIRAVGRRREIAIRVAVGASRWTIVRLFLNESVLLSAVGGICGLGLGAAGIRLLLAMHAVDLPRLGVNGANVAMDWRVLGYTAFTALATGFLFGLIPAIEASRADLASALKEGGRRSGGGFRQSRAQSLFAVSEISLAIVLLIGAALFIRTRIALLSVNPGFDVRHVVTTQVTLDPRLAKATGDDQIAEDLFHRLDTLPGVESAALTGLLPLEGGFNSLTIAILGRPLNGLSHGNARWMTVSPGYFSVLKIPVIRGRLFTDNDQRDAPAVAIVNQAMAREFWPGGNPLDDRLVIGRGLGQNFEEPPRQVVGIVADVHDDALGSRPLPAVFVPLAQRPNGRVTTMWTVVRTHGDPPSLNAAIQAELRRATGGMPVSPLRPMREILMQSTTRQEFNMLLMSIFGGLALTLAAIGIYGLMAYSVQQRTPEIGIRMALGAQSGDVRNMVVAEGMRLALIGVALGLASAFALKRFVESFLFGVKSFDPLVFVLVPFLLSGVAVVAVWLPAQRASRVNPMTALRNL